ncbi:transporter substrate-binding domain-containing protein [Paracoccus sp. (in: a-proteobacteria)]|uniref:transporter substrate-binding domain-containing protein n=1 Tax=Paracoccus sp. TaxID=267 RepID=UPI0028A00823|nr:transporter substrate-binding domain-containing protein [Paracoccus sp. (in: a-proteobacteria)]
MKKLLIAATAFALTSGAGFAETVRIASEGAYAPYNLINDKGELDGYEIDLGNELCKRAELTCTWVKNDFDSMIPNLVSANFDAIMAGMSITDERKKAIQFTQNYLPPVPSAYMALTPDVDVKTAVVASQTGTIQASYVAESGAKLVEFGTFDEAAAAVRNGEADAVFADKDFLVPLVKESNEGFVWVGADVPLGDGIGMGLRQSDTALKDKFDAAITSMKKDGSINTLIEKWFGPEAATFPAQN